MAETDWRKVVTDPVEIKIFEAFEDKKWDWRTTSALVHLSGLQVNEVLRILAKYPVLVRRSTFKDPETGEDLFTLQKRYFEKKGTLRQYWDFLSTSGTST